MSKESLISKFVMAMEYLGWYFTEESWYDEEGVDGTVIDLPNGKEISVYGHCRDIEIEDIVDEIIRLTKIEEENN